MLGEEDPAYDGVDALGNDDQVGLDLSTWRGDPGRAAADDSRVGERGGTAGAHGVGGQPGGDPVDQGGAVDQDQWSAEALGRGGAVRTREPAAARIAHASVALPGGHVADVVAEADDVEGALGVGGEADAGADRFKGCGALQDGDLPAGQAQGHGGGQSADSASDDNGSWFGHDASSMR